ncbi:hypothetical protein F4779DRAFT_566874 [Xylariaceae sp. FL0662B]|nr:hypothetical protein F4779DRAFT_566874 [Xylariaceae sp. FL0662B]
MQIVSIIVLVSLLGITNAKINQYKSVEDCHGDRNNQMHSEGARTPVKSSAKVVFSNEYLNAYTAKDCTGKSLGSLPVNKCNEIEKLFSDKVGCVEPQKD